MSEPYETMLRLPWPEGVEYTEEEAKSLVGQHVPVSADGVGDAGSMLILEAKRELHGRYQMMVVRVRLEGVAAGMLREMDRGAAIASLSAAVRPGMPPTVTRDG